jgi:Zn-dependent peptidase ImmA (M78 family)
MSKVRIGHLDFSIIEMAYVNAKDSYGLYVADAQEIHICKGMTPHKQGEVLLHELLHGVVDTQSLAFVLKDNEEHVVRSMAIGLADLIRDNQKLFLDIVKALK